MALLAIEVLSADECGELREQVHALRGSWAHKGGPAPFYILGVSAYLEAQSHGAIAYTLAAKRQRPGMAEAFGDTYERVRLKLSEALGEPVSYHPRLALPGFQIFLADAAFESPVCRVHIDMPYKNVDWRAWDEVDLSRTISFTLAIAIPHGGAGLNMWPGLEPDLAPTGASPHELTAGIEPVFHPYSVGRMVIHEGHTIHQIAPFQSAAGDERITLQGHAVHSTRGWLAYF